MAAREAINDDRAVLRLERRMIHYAKLLDMLEDTPYKGLLGMPRNESWPSVVNDLEHYIISLGEQISLSLYIMFVYWRYGPDADVVSDYIGTNNHRAWQRHFETSLRNQSPDPFFGLYQ